jgi:quinol monooxygenase YgiN
MKGIVMTTMTVIAEVRPEKREEFLKVVRSLNTGRKKQQGLRKCGLYQEIDYQTHFCLIYRCGIQEDLNLYLGSEKFRELIRALKVLSEETEISFGREVLRIKNNLQFTSNL